jgi:hypothetical protein
MIDTLGQAVTLKDAGLVELKQTISPLCDMDWLIASIIIQSPDAVAHDLRFRELLECLCDTMLLFALKLWVHRQRKDTPGESFRFR